MALDYGLILDNSETFRFCHTCDGTGWEPADICHVCDGWGWRGYTSQEITNAIASVYIKHANFATPISMRYRDQFN